MTAVVVDGPAAGAVAGPAPGPTSGLVSGAARVARGAGLGRYVAGRVAQALVVLWAAWTATFAILWLLPSDPLALLLSANNVEVDSLSPAELAAAQARYGLDQPVLVQYGRMLGDALHGDLGVSITKNVPVTQLLAERLPGTLQLSGLAVLLALAGGLTVAWLAAWVRWRPAKVLLSRLPSAGVAFPSFWVGLLLIQVFAFTLGWFPSTGDEGPAALVLPAVTMAIPTSAVFAQVLTRSLEDTLAQPWITTARATGLSRAGAQARHALRNAALPTLTILGLLVGGTVTGAIVTETVFARQGVGMLAQEAVLSQDVPVVQAVVVLAAAAFVLVNLLVDLLYPLLDPRISHAVRTPAARTPAARTSSPRTSAARTRRRPS
ncbi:ABC transporter permease [Cellulomonas marina]|uniref:Peptide/nickel transport system permease protein n=1 Tax=Cellulomonas marina TaxID=988821 RepID=A0A1I0ZF09_9CELL|nr:ABC transporter permease [Cellulomonas marina]GIG28527.1 peptide ABC transporter permease [Cellulomonas marina]SFB24379.1 peptide/nickel transport system permease protein [Cellulomonas marina]